MKNKDKNTNDDIVWVKLYDHSFNVDGLMVCINDEASMFVEPSKEEVEEEIEKNADRIKYLRDMMEELIKVNEDLRKRINKE